MPGEEEFEFSADLLTGDDLNEDDVGDELLRDVRKLKQAWINEKVCPELLQYEHEVVETLLEQIENQSQAITEGAQENIHNAFTANLYEMEVDRLSFIVRSYLRIRLWKIEKYISHILSDPKQRACLSTNELHYARNHVGSLEKHLKDCCLLELPEHLRSLNEQNDTVDMITKPNLDSYVFCGVLEDIGQFHFDEGGDGDVLEGDLTEGDVYIIRYRAIQSLLATGKVTLL